MVHQFDFIKNIDEDQIDFTNTFENNPIIPDYKKTRQGMCNICKIYP